MIGVADNQKYLTFNGKPFFYLADTAWELFHRLNQEEANHYLRNRAAKRFNVVQAVGLAELDGLNTPNAYGETPLYNNDPMQPNEEYWRHVDWVITRAAELSLITGLLPTWADKVLPVWGGGLAIFDTQNAYTYGCYLGRRYRHLPIIWILGGDRPALHEDHDTRPIWRAMAEGIKAGVDGPTLMTYHPPGGTSSSASLHDEPWLDFNMLQSGHGAGRDVAVWDMITADYDRVPSKPVLDGEPNYEDHPVSPWPVWIATYGYFRDYDVRKQAYRSVFAGGCGITYGHHAIWQFYGPAREIVNHADRYWTEALDRPGAEQMQHLRSLIESRPMLPRIPDQSLIVDDAGDGPNRIQATRAADGSYAFVYSSAGQPFKLDLTKLHGSVLQAWWFDPRTGVSYRSGKLSTASIATWTPPSSGEGQDWVLVLDDVAQGFGSPGELEQS